MASPRATSFEVEKVVLPFQALSAILNSWRPSFLFFHLAFGNDSEVQVRSRSCSALGDSEAQLKSYLSDRDCENGCLTDGFIWQF